MQVFNEPPTLPFYSQPGVMTDPGGHASLLEDLPGDVAALAAVAQGLIIHEHLAPVYGVTLSDADRATVHVRRVADLLERIVATDSRPLTQASPPPGCPGTAGISPS